MRNDGHARSLPLPRQIQNPQLQCKLSEARAKLALPQDPATGRALYKPQTGRGPSFTRHTPEQGVGEYLHALQSERVRGWGT